MKRFVLCVAALFSLAPEAQGQAGRTDRNGDPLPAGAVARLGTTRLRHNGQVLDAAFSADGKVLASFGEDNRLRLWDTADGKELQGTLLKSLFALSSFTPAVAVAPDGKTVAVSASRQLALCDVGKAEPRLPPEFPDWISGLAFAPDGKLLAVFGTGAAVTLIDPATGREVRKLEGHGKAVLGAAFAADGRTMVTTSEDLTCRVWNVADGKQLKQLQTGQRRAFLVAVSPDGKWLAWWDDEGMVSVRDLGTGKEKTSFKAAGPLFILDWRQSTLRFTPDGTLHALHWSRHLHQWHPEGGLKSRDFDPVSGKTAFGRLAPDGKLAALWDWDHGHALYLFDLRTGKEREVAVGHQKPVYTVLARPGGKQIATTSTDGTIRLWDAATSREVRRWRPESTWHPVAFTPDGKALAFGAYDNKSFIRVVNPDTNEQLRRLDTDRTRALALSGDGKLLLTADFTRIEVWDFTTGKRLRELEEVPETKQPPLKLSTRGPWLSYTVRALCASPDGKLAAAAFTRGGAECSVYLWDTATGKRLAGWPGEGQLRAPIGFAPDGKFFAATPGNGENAGDVVLWDVARRKVVRRFPVADPACGSVAFSRDGRRVALGGYYRDIVQLYEVAYGKEITRFQAHEGLVTLAFADDGATLITGHRDSTVLVWEWGGEHLPKLK
jgi:WD40 repeat protein